MNHAFIDRLNICKIGFMPADSETDIMMAQFRFGPEMRPYVKNFVELANTCRAAFENEELPSFIFTTRRLAALFDYLGDNADKHQKAGLSNHDRILDAAKYTIASIASDTDFMAIAGHIKRIFKN
jgi:hypothetical protein